MEKEAKKKCSRIGFALLAGSVISNLVAIVLINFLYLRGYYESAEAIFENEYIKWGVNFLPIYLLGFPCAIWIMKNMPVVKPEKTSLGLWKFIKIFIICIPVMYLGNIVGNVLSSFFSGGQVNNSLELFALDDSILKVIVMVILAPVYEELIFRKIIIDRTKVYGEKNAIIFSGLLFGLYHMNLFQLFYAAGLGVIFAYVYVRTGQLKHCIGLHMIINFMGSVVAPYLIKISNIEGLDMAKAEQNIMQMSPLVLYSFALIILSIVGILLLITSRKKIIFRETKEELFPMEAWKSFYLNPGMIFYMLIAVGMTAFTILLPYIQKLMDM